MPNTRSSIFCKLFLYNLGHAGVFSPISFFLSFTKYFFEGNEKYTTCINTEEIDKNCDSMCYNTEEIDKNYYFV